MMQRLIQLARPNWAADDNVTPHESIPMLIKGTKDEENFVAHFIFIPDAHGVGLEVGNPKLGKRVLPLQCIALSSIKNFTGKSSKQKN